MVGQDFNGTKKYVRNKIGYEKKGKKEDPEWKKGCSMTVFKNKKGRSAFAKKNRKNIMHFFYLF